jgi:hypothetical protein
MMKDRREEIKNTIMEGLSLEKVAIDLIKENFELRDWTVEQQYGCVSVVEVTLKLPNGVIVEVSKAGAL